MSDLPRDVRLQADLVQLRAALRNLQAPPPDESALLEQFRVVARERARAEPIAARGAGSWRMHFAAAAIVVLAVGAVLAAVLLRIEPPPSLPVAAETRQPQLAANPFQPLLHSPGLSPSLSYSVVRVRIPLSAFALVPGTQEDGMVEADLLVGEDGLARGIRFAGADTMLVSVAGQ